MEISRSVLLFVLAGLAEIGGGYLIWLWLREGRPWANGFASLLLATLACQEGVADAARSHLMEAIVLFDATGMQLYAAVARRCLASQLGDAGAHLEEQATAWMQGQEIRDRAAMTQLIAPGFFEPAIGAGRR